jgi:TonB family protein
MPPIVKDSETPTATPISAGPGATAAKTKNESQNRPRPVALEIPVTVNGARTVEGSDKREPFSESTTTVLVFSQGAVIRLAFPLASGQLIFLTNEKSKKEVVCQVVKSKNVGGAGGFVELEFTEPAIGFWGLRFPSDHLVPTGDVPAIAPAAPRAVGPVVAVPSKVAAPPRPAPPVAAKPASPVSSGPAIPVAAKPAVVAPPPPAPKPTAPVTPAPVNAIAPPPPPVPAEQEVIAAKLASHPLPLTDYGAAISALFDTPSVSEAKPAAKEAPKVETAPAHAEPSTEQLKMQAARLQEQLGSLLFSETPVQPPSTPASANIAKKEAPKPQVADRLPQRPQTAPKPAAPAEIKPVAAARNLAPPPLAAEQVKVPAWLAPLAHESESAIAGPTALPELSALSDALPPSPSVAANSLTVGVAELHHQHSPAIGGHLLGESKAPAPAVASHSKKGLLIGLAATLLLAAGVVWYLRQPANLVSRLLTLKHAQVAKLSPAAVSAPTPQPVVPVAGTSKSVPVPANSPASHGEPPATAAATLAPAPLAAAKNLKKSAVGQVHLATPVVTRADASPAGNETDPSLDVNQQSPNVDPLAGLAAGHRKEPTAPLVVGGEVKPPHLLKSVAPSYPATARAQNIAGDVKIDALIDAKGGVGAVKVISGPVLLHQAALDAVKQWKYEPAQLNGQPTAIHLTVTVHFHNQ